MKQVTNEEAIFVTSCLLKDLDDACPDVGMGYPLAHFVEMAAARLGLQLADFDPDKVIDLHTRAARARRRR